MINFGVEITDRDGVTNIFDEKFTAYTILDVIDTSFKGASDSFFCDASGKLKSSNGRYINSKIKIPNNHGYLLIPSAGDYFQPFVRYSYTQGNVVYKEVLVKTSATIHQLNENRELMIGYYNSSFDIGYNVSPSSNPQSKPTIIWAQQYITILIYPQSEQVKNDFGLSINNGNSDNFHELITPNDYARVLWKGDISIDKYGWQPKSINSTYESNNVIPFFYWQNADITMGQLPNTDAKFTNDSINQPGYTGKYYAYDKNGETTLLNAKVVIFGTKAPTKSDFGMEIYNANGKLSFSSVDGHFSLPEIIDLSNIKENEIIKLSSINYPLIHPVAIGGAGFSSRDIYSGYDLGIANTGHELIAKNGRRINLKSSSSTAVLKNDGFNPTTSAFPVLDASKYFSF